MSSPQYGRLAGLVTPQHIPSLILHIIACRILTEKDVFTYILYFVVNGIDIDVAISLLQLNFTLNVFLERRFYDIWEYVDEYWMMQPRWFTYFINRGGVYYINGEKKNSRPISLFDWCDLEVVNEFLTVEFDWDDYRLIWDSNFGGYRLWRYDRLLPEGCVWAVERYQ